MKKREGEVQENSKWYYNVRILLLLCSLVHSLNVELTFFSNFPRDTILVHNTVKKVSDFPVSSRDVTNQTLPGREKLNYSPPGRVWLVTSRLGMRKSLTFFLQCRVLDLDWRAWFESLRYGWVKILYTSSLTAPARASYAASIMLLLTPPTMKLNKMPISLAL